ncbi:deoxyribonuclease IV [Mumia zhuanghuii]|uniref:Probable endonuclease 4 n=2 Tax=Mumia TaxID=1546255 RepID=A0ABW1QIM3_9ACTN|nr:MULTISPECIES: deoxyribonuclease IV [Mumia]KAA1423494.1 deoxyribonuclease IV [Mumia zhuanghuii]
MPSPSAPAPVTHARNPIGSHVPVGPGLARGAFPAMRHVGADTLQVFVGNPRGWAASAGDPRQDAQFRERCESEGVPAFVHTPYLVNLGSPNPTTYEKSVATVAHNLARGASIGARGVVVHTGSCVDDGAYDKALAQVREGLLPLLDVLPDDAPTLLLEPTAGQGRSLCARIDDLAPYLEALDHHPRVGICLDTCHAFAAGEPLDEPQGVVATLDRLVEVAGPDRLQLVHANDSQDVRGSFKDRHERIGRGHIGVEAFAAMFLHPATVGVPFVLETPGASDAWAEDITLLASLRDRVAVS